MVFDVSWSPTFQENIRVSRFLLTSLDHLPSPELLKSLRICQTLEEGSLATPYSTGSCYQFPALIKLFSIHWCSYYDGKCYPANCLRSHESLRNKLAQLCNPTAGSKVPGFQCCGSVLDFLGLEKYTLPPTITAVPITFQLVKLC